MMGVWRDMKAKGGKRKGEEKKMEWLIDCF